MTLQASCGELGFISWWLDFLILKFFSNLDDLRLLKVVRGKLGQGGVTKGGGTRNLPSPCYLQRFIWQSYVSRC